MKITRALVLDVLAFTFGSLLAEFLIQRHERAARKADPAPAP